MRSFLIYSAIVLSTTTPAFACWQSEQPPVVLRTISLNGRTTYEEDWRMPRGRITLELHKAITFDRGEAKKTGAYEKSILKSVSTDSNGLFSFGEVRPGRYWVVLGSSLSDAVAVEVAVPGKNMPYQRMRLRYFSDGCREFLVENIN